MRVLITGAPAVGKSTIAALLCTIHFRAVPLMSVESVLNEMFESGQLEGRARREGTSSALVVDDWDAKLEETVVTELWSRSKTLDNAFVEAPLSARLENVLLHENLSSTFIVLLAASEADRMERNRVRTSRIPESGMKIMPAEMGPTTLTDAMKRSVGFVALSTGAIAAEHAARAIAGLLSGLRFAVQSEP